MNTITTDNVLNGGGSAASTGATWTNVACSGSASACSINPYPYNYPWWQQPVVEPNYSHWYYPMAIDYDLLADKVADRIKGTKERSKEEIRKEINKLLSELEKAK